jgi:glycosyltransferase involved in cell wall biosynthesis
MKKIKHRSQNTVHRTLSVVIATRNEEENIGRCIVSVRSIVDEIIIFDESSTDRTEEIAKKLGAKVFKVKHNDNFHITKQKAIEKAKGDWILQLDADEAVTPQLAVEIKEIVGMSNEKLLSLEHDNPQLSRLFKRHQDLVEKRDGKLGKPTGEVVAFFIPRVNMFFGKPLIHGGVYPDGVIRLIKRGKARLPAKSVHEQMEIDGEVGWLFGNLEHYDSPTFGRYLWRNNRYTELIAKDLKADKIPKNILSLLLYCIYKPLYTFSDLYFRHKGILDGYRGFIWCFFSSLRFPISYIKYWNMNTS